MTFAYYIFINVPVANPVLEEKVKMAGFGMSAERAIMLVIVVVIGVFLASWLAVQLGWPPAKA